MKWRIIIDNKNSPEYNMAKDEAILNGVIKKKSPPTIRFYNWDPPTASCGYNQTANKEVDFTLLRKKGYAFIRRPTGGRLVLHKNEVTYSVIAPLKEFLQGNVTHTYSQISLALAEGFKLMGINLTLERGNLPVQHQRETTNPCFTSTSKYELSYKKKKIVGSAQVRKDNCFLQHGSILLHQNQKEVGELLPVSTEEKRNKIIEYLDRKTISINQILKKKVDYYMAVNYLISGFKKAWEKEFFFIDNNLSLYEENMITYFILNKYKNEDWNYRR